MDSKHGGVDVSIAMDASHCGRAHVGSADPSCRSGVALQLLRAFAHPMHRGLAHPRHVVLVGELHELQCLAHAKLCDSKRRVHGELAVGWHKTAAWALLRVEGWRSTSHVSSTVPLLLMRGVVADGVAACIPWSDWPSRTSSTLPL